MGVSSFLGSKGKDTAKDRNLGSLGGLETLSIPTLITLRGLGWFFDDRGPYKWEMVFSILKQFHSAGYMW